MINVHQPNLHRMRRRVHRQRKHL